MISVIIPAYNVKEHIGKCLDSLVKQNFSPFEVIIIDDGSTDGTSEILDYYSTRYDFINVFSIKNSGVSNARNLGISYSKGKYITFCDADDWYDNNVLKNIFETIEKYDCDLVVYGRRDIFSNSQSFPYNKHFQQKLLRCEKAQYLREVFALGNHTFSVCNKVYRKEILTKNNITFDKDLKLSEDTLFNLKYIVFASKIAEDYRASYNRLYREGSAIYKKLNNFYAENIMIIERFKEFIVDNTNCVEFEEGLLLMYYLYGKVSIFRNFDGIDGDSRHERIKTISSIINDESFIKSYQYMELKPNSMKERIFLFLTRRKKAFLLYLVFGELVKIKRNLKRLI